MKEKCSVIGCRRVAWYPDQRLYDEPAAVCCDECLEPLCRQHAMEGRDDTGHGKTTCEDCYAGASMGRG